MVNQLLIGTTTRDYYGARIECRAQGTRLLQPVTKDVTVQVHRKWNFLVLESTASPQLYSQ